MDRDDVTFFLEGYSCNKTTPPPLNAVLNEEASVEVEAQGKCETAHVWIHLTNHS